MITHPRKSTLTGLVQFLLVSSVVIAVIAVLFPVFEASHESSIHSLQNRLRDLGAAMQQYTDDNDGLVPAGTCSFKIGGHRSLTGLGWAGELYPYVNSPKDFDDAMGGTAGDSTYGSVVAFAINENCSRNGKPSSWTDRSKTVLLFQVVGAHAKIDEPNEGNCDGSGACSPAGNGTIVMFMDGLCPRVAQPATGDLGRRKIDNMTAIWPAPEVDGGAYYLMADGHVKWFTPAEVSSGKESLTCSGGQTGGVTGRAAGTNNAEYEATFSTK